MVAILISIVELPLAKLVEESIKILKFLQKFPEIFYSYINHTQLLINHLNSPIILWGFWGFGVESILQLYEEVSETLVSQLVR